MSDQFIEDLIDIHAESDRLRAFVTTLRPRLPHAEWEAICASFSTAFCGLVEGLQPPEEE